MRERERERIEEVGLHGENGRRYMVEFFRVVVVDYGNWNAKDTALSLCLCVLCEIKLVLLYPFEAAFGFLLYKTFPVPKS